MTDDYLNTLLESDVCQEKFSLLDILENSLYYPACFSDGDPIRFCNRYAQYLGIRSFVYCDYGPWFEEPGALYEVLSRTRGYRIFATCDINVERLFPSSWKPYYRRHYYEEGQKSFCKWVIYERLPGYGNDHGPSRFSMLYVGAEGLTTYMALYERHGVCPKVLAVINPGMDRISDFDECDGPLFRLLSSHGTAMPHMILRTGFPGEIQGYTRLPSAIHERFSVYQNNLPAELHYRKESNAVIYEKLRLAHKAMAQPFPPHWSEPVTEAELDAVWQLERNGHRITSSVIQDALNVTYDKAQAIIRRYLGVVM